MDSTASYQIPFGEVPSAAEVLDLLTIILKSLWGFCTFLEEHDCMLGGVIQYTALQIIVTSTLICEYLW